MLDIKCPDNDCKLVFNDEQIRKILPEDHYQEYSVFKKNKLLSQNPNLRWCIRLGCEKYVIGKEGSKKVTCECGTQICFECRNAYHPNKTCEQALDASYKDYLKKNNVQRCPKCKSGVEKIDGCNHMTCW